MSRRTPLATPELLSTKIAAPRLRSPLVARETLLARLDRGLDGKLTLLSSGLTNPEIAQELVVSINTIKTQVKSIYCKLNVSNRPQAGTMLRSMNVYLLRA